MRFTNTIIVINFSIFCLMLTLVYKLVRYCAKSGWLH